jgi:zinc protease
MNRILSPLFLLVALLMFVGVQPASGQQSADLRTTLPLDPAVRSGELRNGLQYFIRQNTEPRNRAELRLVINVGSVVEDEDQLGLAHFVEHMLFNGTERFAEQELVSFLERIGMRFGPDVNAYTSFDETVYMLQIPTDDAEIIRRSFEVLEDWAARALLDAEEIDKERGVVIEEWRMSTQNAQRRILDQILPALLHDSRYQHRLPIGDPEIIRTADYETVRRFYRDWYRPDLMAIVVVGDINIDQMEAKIIEHFSSLENPVDAREREVFTVPGHAETLFVVATDPEYPVATVEVSFKREAARVRTEEDFRRQLTVQLFNRMLNDRFAEMTRRADAPFLQASASRGSFVRTSEYAGLQALVREDGILAGLDALVTEASRVRQHGFVASELDRQKSEVLRSFQRSYNERERTNSAAFAAEYVNFFLTGEASPGIAFEFQLAQQVMPSITLEEVNALAADLLSTENRAVIVAMPEKEGLVPPTAQELAAVLDEVSVREVAAYEENVGDEPLLATTPAAGEVAATRTIDSFGVTEVRLSNGVTIVMKPTAFRNDEVRFTAFAPGGTSLADDDILLESSFAASLVAQSGVSRFNRTELQRKLAGQVVNVSPYIGELEQGLRGNASPDDLETLFELIHLYFVEPRMDEEAVAAFKNQQRALLANRAATPFGVFQDSLQAALYQNHPRRRTPSANEIDAIDPARALRFFQDRFADASDFTFVFVGNFEEERMIELSSRYLGSLPAPRHRETWRDVAPRIPGGVIERNVYKGLAEQGQSVLIFHGPMDYTREERHRLRTVNDVLAIMLREDLREDRGGVYGVQTQASSAVRPDANYQVVVAFGSDPARSPELIDAVMEQIALLQTRGPSEDHLNRVREAQRRERETSLEQNAFWLGTLLFYYQNPDEDIQDIDRYLEMVDATTADDIREAANLYLDKSRFVRVVLFPETMQP